MKLILLTFVYLVSATGLASSGTSVSPFPFGKSLVTAPTGNTLVFAGEVKKGVKYSIEILRVGPENIEQSKLVMMTNSGEKRVPAKSTFLSETDNTFKVKRTFQAPESGKVYYRAHILSGKEFKGMHPTQDSLKNAYAKKAITKGGDKITSNKAELEKSYKSYTNPPKSIKMSVSIKPVI